MPTMVPSGGLIKDSRTNTVRVIFGCVNCFCLCIEGSVFTALCDFQFCGKNSTEIIPEQTVIHLFVSKTT